MNAFEGIVDRLRREIGLDPKTLGTSTVADAISERCRVVGLSELTDYARRIEADPGEFRELIERLLVRETWFFRGGELFDHLARTVRDALAANPGRVIRTLSIPCSSGEEPYSLAIAFAERRLPPERCPIDAIDLSDTAITAARIGRYREFAFRQTLPPVRDRYFTAHESAWELSSAIRERVRFRTGNILDASLVRELGTVYEVVLCRNLLIYLTPAARRRTMDALESLLAPGGLLAVGSAEPSVLAGRNFRVVPPSELFLYERDSGVPADPLRLPLPPPKSNRTSTTLAAPAPRPVPPPLAASPALVRDIPLPLAAARQHADAGRLDQAMAECQRIVTGTPSADGYALLGIIHQARGDLTASAEALRRALYLEPNHCEALTHALAVALAAEQFAQAETFRARIRKLPAEDRS